MHLTAECLRRAKRENVERLARSLGVRLPGPTRAPTVYDQRLIHAVMQEIRQQAENDAFDRILRF